jgi:hypothetical protein
VGAGPSVEAAPGRVGGQQGQDQDHDPADTGDQDEEVERAREVGVVQAAPRDGERGHDDREGEDEQQDAADDQEGSGARGLDDARGVLVGVAGAETSRGGVAGGPGGAHTHANGHQDGRDQAHQEGEQGDPPVLAAGGATTEVRVLAEEALDGLSEACAVEGTGQVRGIGGSIELPVRGFWIDWWHGRDGHKGSLLKGCG